MNPLTAAFREHARAAGADLVGIASIDRFDGLPLQHHPSSIFPEAQSVIVMGRRVTRGTLRGVEEGTQFSNYRLYGYDWLDNRFVALTIYRAAEFLEDRGWEAVPLLALPPEIPPMGVSVRPDAPPPNVLVDLDDAAVRAGLGEIGYARFLLTPQFGPRQRVQAILTDAVLEPDPLYDGQICDRDPAAHAAFCPLGALDGSKEETLTICGKEMRVARVDWERCAACENGAHPNRYHASGKPDRLAALCARSCLVHLEESGALSNVFQAPFRKRAPWAVDRGTLFAGDPFGR
jgi:epoxyqueuosine reductase QueG